MNIDMIINFTLIQNLTYIFQAMDANYNINTLLQESTI